VAQSKRREILATVKQSLGYLGMKIDCSKLSNKDDLVVLIGTVFILLQFGFVIYLAATENTFLSGFIASTIIWKWKDWVYNPINNYLELHWPSS
jgi:hypothetical protein